MIVANEILRQLGGNRFTAMTGSKNYAGTENSLRMNLTTNKAKAKYLEIVLMPNDTYNVTFFSVNKNYERIIKKGYVGVYCDQLREIFEAVTGLCTSL